MLVSFLKEDIEFLYITDVLAGVAMVCSLVSKPKKNGIFISRIINENFILGVSRNSRRK
jgi:hypothetical protein